jgi:stage III sporulation protein AG
MMLVSVWKRIPKQAVWILLALGAGLLLLLPGKTADTVTVRESGFPFSLEAEEKRIETALSRIEGAGKVTVVLTLEASEERVYARNTDSDKLSETDGGRSEERSEVARVGDSALTVKVAYPRYRGALIVTEGSGSGLKLDLTQAVSALTGLSSDRITVVTGS